jgi:tRNA A-37 threonylcarbamoyl transferase component Bud32/Flp pilus assembly protein TadD
VSQARRVDSLCDEFEEAWKAGRRPRIEEQLAEVGEPECFELLRELVRLELHYRRAAGEDPQTEQYRERFPALARAGTLESGGVLPESQQGKAEKARSEDVLEAVSETQAKPTLDKQPGQEAKDSPNGEPGAGLRYRPLCFHARGGIGEVHVGEDTELQRKVALKRIQAERADDVLSRERFLREAHITARLEHPGIVPVHGLVHDDDGQTWYAMRFIEGHSLKAAIERFHAADQYSGRRPGERNLALRQLLGHFIAVCNTMAYAHNRGIIHRDLKPANIMLGKYGETLVVDWGLAKAVGRSESDRWSGEETVLPAAVGDAPGTLAGQICGTPAYMSPEQADGDPEIGRASDIFSLGATLFHLLTGKAPYHGTNALRKARRLEHSRPRQLNRHVPAALEAICLKAMAAAPQERYGTAFELASELERWLADEPVRARRESALARVRRLLRRHRTVATALTTLILAGLLMGGANWIWMTQQQADELSRRARESSARAAQEHDQRIKEAEAELKLASEIRKEARLAAEDSQSKWKAALEAATRAERLVSRDGADARLRDQASALLKQIETEARNHQLLALLDDARLIHASSSNEDAVDFAQTSQLYERAFKSCNVDIKTLDPDAAAEQLSDPSIKAAVVAGLDDWAERSIDRDLRPRLLAILDKLDSQPESFRQRWRRARGNRDLLTRLAKSPEAASLSPGDQAWLGRSLSEAGATAEAVELLHKAYTSHPEEFWICFELARALYLDETPSSDAARLDGVIRYYNAALAARPRCSVVYNNLGVALIEKKDHLGAIAALRRAISLNPTYGRVYNNLGIALDARGDEKGAIAAYDKAAALMAGPKYP